MIFLRREREAFAALDAGQIDARQQHGQLAGLKLNARARRLGRGQTERAFFEPLVPDGVPVGVPVENLEAILPAASEQEQVFGERIKPQRLADQRRQRIKALAHVGRSRAQVNTHARARVEFAQTWQLQHAGASAWRKFVARSTPSTSDNACRSTGPTPVVMVRAGRRPLPTTCR